MFKQYLRNIEGITDYPLFLVVVFFLFFAIVTAAIVFTGKKKLMHVSALPFNDCSIETENNK
jgi:hypothetical protein